MTAPSYSLASASSTFAADGTCRMSVGPRVYGFKWHVDRIVISSTNTNTVQPTVQVFRAVETPSALVDYSHRGNADVSETSLDLQAGDALIFVWSGGSVGGVATISLTGTQERA